MFYNFFQISSNFEVINVSKVIEINFDISASPGIKITMDKICLHLLYRNPDLVARKLTSKVINVYFFSSLPICMSAVSLFIASLCPSINGAVFERMFTSRCLCANIKQCTITLSLQRCPPLRFCFVLLKGVTGYVR